MVLVLALAEALKDPGWSQQADDSESVERCMDGAIWRARERQVSLLAPGAVVKTSCRVTSESAVEPGQEEAGKC